MGKSRTPRDDGPPVSITIYSTPHGWRHSVLTKNGSLLCGALGHLPADASAEQAQVSAADLVRGLGTEFHDLNLDLNWQPGSADGWWLGTVYRLDSTPN